MDGKSDLKKALKPLYSPPAGRFVTVDVPPLRYLMIDGQGDPNTSPVYAAAVQWLYATSYALKFASKAAGRDYAVMPLEALWWADDMSTFTSRDKDAWSWTVMILQPDWTTPEMLQAAIAKSAAKLGDAPPTLRLATLEEGTCVQTLHVGSYDDEGPVLAKLHKEYLPAHGLRETGLHHEIYLSDPRKVPAAKLKTILRQPVEPAG